MRRIDCSPVIFCFDSFELNTGLEAEVPALLVPWCPTDCDPKQLIHLFIIPSVFWSSVWMFERDFAIKFQYDSCVFLIAVQCPINFKPLYLTVIAVKVV